MKTHEFIGHISEGIPIKANIILMLFDLNIEVEVSEMSGPLMNYVANELMTRIHNKT